MLLRIPHRALAMIGAFAIAGCSTTTSQSPAPSEESTAVRANQRSLATAPATSTHNAPSVLEPGAVRNAPSATRATVVAPQTQPVIPNPTTRIVVHPIAASEGEDGGGNTIAARNPVAIDLIRDNGWQAGALTTTLYVGTLHFHNMGYLDGTIMRFIVADRALLPTTEEVALQYGEHPSTRRVLATGLTVQP